MIIKNMDASTNVPYLWLPIFLYDEPILASQVIASIELILYSICLYIVVVSLKIFVQVRMFHLNFIILVAPFFGIWFELIIGKLITMCYQLSIFSIGNLEIRKFYVLWTDDSNKMLVVNSFEGLELLIIAGFMEYHYMFSVVFGAVAVAIERLAASVLIE